MLYKYLLIKPLTNDHCSPKSSNQSFPPTLSRLRVPPSEDPSSKTPRRDCCEVPFKPEEVVARPEVKSRFPELSSRFPDSLPFPALVPRMSADGDDWKSFSIPSSRGGWTPMVYVPFEMCIAHIKFHFCTNKSYADRWLPCAIRWNGIDRFRGLLPSVKNWSLSIYYYGAGSAMTPTIGWVLLWIALNVDADDEFCFGVGNPMRPSQISCRIIQCQCI